MSHMVVGRYRMATWHAGPEDAGLEHARNDIPPVVCVHGAGISSRPLMPLVRSLGARVETWTVDLPGFGRSSKPAHPLSLTELGDALAAWIQAADLPYACLLGCSFGCQIAVDVAVRHPDLVHSLVLAGPTTDPESRSWGKILGRWLRNAAHESPRMLPLNVADYRDCGMRRAIHAFHESLIDRLEDRLPAVAAPTLVVRGELDGLVPSAWAEEVTRLIPDARLVTVPGSPHMIPFKAPDRLVPLVTDFLEASRAT